MKTTPKTITAVRISTLSLTLAGLAVAPTTAHAASSDRLFGTDRYQTSLKVSAHVFPSGAQTVYIARGDILADALAGGALTDGPVILTKPNSVSDADVEAEVQRLNPSTVIALGGSDVVKESLLVNVAGGRATGRLAGGSRYDTAVAISKRAFPNGVRTAYLANGVLLADAVSGGILTAGPILPVPPTGVTPVVIKNEVARLGVSNVIALGGTGAVSAKTLNDFAPRSLSRIAGQNRYETSAAIAAHEFKNKKANSVYLARGDVFADAVSAGSVTDGPIILVHQNAPMAAGGNVTKNLAPQHITALGSTSVVPNNIVSFFKNAAEGLLPPVSSSSIAGWTSFESEILRLTNVERAKGGLKPLQPSPCLRSVAKKWSDYQVAHNIYEHGNLGPRIWGACPSAGMVGENIFKYPGGTPAQLIQGWMNSPGHKSNMMNREFKYLGVGRSTDGSITTQDFSANKV